MPANYLTLSNCRKYITPIKSTTNIHLWLLYWQNHEQLHSFYITKLPPIHTLIHIKHWLMPANFLKLSNYRKYITPIKISTNIHLWLLYCQTHELLPLFYFTKLPPSHPLIHIKLWLMADNSLKFKITTKSIYGC
jgi:hypothetical protein